MMRALNALAHVPLVPFLALNNRHATELSFLAACEFERLVGIAFYAKGYADQSGFLLAFDQDALYSSPNFHWVKARYARFVYIDRVVVDSAARSQGRARTLYKDLFGLAKTRGVGVIAAEVNSDPPNPISDAFHEGLGFETVGSAVHASRGKTVRYIVRRLGEDAGAVVQ